MINTKNIQVKNTEIIHNCFIGLQKIVDDSFTIDPNINRDIG